MAAVASFSGSHENGHLDNANIPTDPENVYKVSREFWKNRSKKNVVARWRPFWLSVESWKSNQVISIFMGNFT